MTHAIVSILLNHTDTKRPSVAIMPDFFCIAFINMHDAKLEFEVFRVNILYSKYYVIHTFFCIIIIFSLRFECKAHRNKVASAPALHFIKMRLYSFTCVTVSSSFYYSFLMLQKPAIYRDNQMYVQNAAHTVKS